MVLLLGLAIVLENLLSRRIGENKADGLRILDRLNLHYHHVNMPFLLTVVVSIAANFNLACQLLLP